jgi:AsmA protein
MKPSQLPWKWLLLGPVAVLAVGLAFTPWLLGDTSRFANRIAGNLSAWSGGKVRFTGPVRISLFPEITVRGRLELTDIARLPFVRRIDIKEARASLDLPDLLRGRVRIDVLRLQKPKVQLNEGVTPSGERAPTLVTNLLSNLPVRVLSIRNGRLDLPTQNIKQVFAHIDAGKENGALSILGFFSYGQERVRFTIESGSSTTSSEAAFVPVSITVNSSTLRGKLNSTASFGEVFNLDGGIDAQIDDVRRFLRWVGYQLPDGDSLKNMTLAGTFHFSGSTFAVEDGVFSLDGNRAIGVLAFSPKARPRVEGTLAFDQLVLDPYLGKSSPHPTQTQLPPGQLLLSSVDADLRVSANAISAKSFILGAGGFTLSARNGSVTSEIGELQLCGGRADGRVDLGLAPSKNTLNLAASISEVALEPCLAPLSLGVPLRGTGDLSLDLAADGTSEAGLIADVTGRFKLNVQSGTVPLDLSRFLTTSTPIEVKGWADGGGNNFDRLQADCNVDTGQIHCENLSLQRGEENIAVAGDIDLTKGTMNWTLTAGPAAGPVSVSVPSSAPALSIRGPLAQPSIRRTDRATVGEGRPPANPAPSQVQPH